MLHNTLQYRIQEDNIAIKLCLNTKKSILFFRVKHHCTQTGADDMAASPSSSPLVTRLPRLPPRPRAAQLTSTSTSEYNNAGFAVVTFSDILEIYYVHDADNLHHDVTFRYVIGKTLYASRRDVIGLYKV